MYFTLSQAAKEARVSKSTISKALSQGRLSGTRIDDGSFQIDAAELFRVFPRRTSEQVFANGSGTVREQRRVDNEPPETEFALLQLRVRMLEHQIDREREVATQLQELTEHERQIQHETISDLRKRLDRAEERVLALTLEPVTPSAAVSTAAAEEIRPKDRRGLLFRLFARF